MIKKNNIIAFFSILAEASYLFLPYLLIATLLKTASGQLISFVYIFLTVILITTLNTLIASKTIKRINLIIINTFVTLAITILLLILYGYGNTGSIFSLFWFRESVWIAMEVWLLAVYIGIIAFRSIVITNQVIMLKEAIIRFEISMAFFLSTAILAGVLHVAVAENMLIILVGLLSNCIAMTLCKQSSNISWKYLTVGTVGLAIFLGSLLTLFKLGQNYLINLSSWIYNTTIPYISGSFLGFMKWILVKGKYIENDNSASSLNSGEVATSGWKMSNHITSQWLEYIVWLLIGLVGLITLVIIIMLVINLVKYLLRPNKTRLSADEYLKNNSSLIYLLWSKLKTLISKMKLLYHIYIAKDLNLENVYSYFLLWGKQRNIPRLDYETPFEYCQRLIISYPHQAQTLNMITESYVSYRYGKVKHDQDTIKMLNKSIKNLYVKII